SGASAASGTRRSALTASSSPIATPSCGSRRPPASSESRPTARTSSSLFCAPESRRSGAPGTSRAFLRTQPGEARYLAEIAPNERRGSAGIAGPRRFRRPSRRRGRADRGALASRGIVRAGGPDMEHEIGEAAGQIWRWLEENGEATVARLKQDAKLTEPLVYMGIGWLAREGKIELIKDKRTV